MRKDELIAKLREVKVVPVIDPKSAEDCLAAVDALIAGGATVLEITLRSQLAYQLFPEVRARAGDRVVGAGSVMEAEVFDKAVEMGADFTISPGRCKLLESHVKDSSVTHIPGVVTPTEIIDARRAGQTLLKFYPSEASGGAAQLKDLGRIFPDVLMMPSGGIKEDHLEGYAGAPNVASVGGSWMYSRDGAYLPVTEISSTMKRSIKAMQAKEAR